VTDPQLARRLGLTDAVLIGLGSMIGAGVFSAFAPAAAAAGAGLLIGLAVAAAVAYCNATASAQLAAQYPVSGGTYVYGRERLGDWGDSSRAGDSSWARRPVAPRWPSPSPPTPSPVRGNARRPWPPSSRLLP
jgi:hypothetical protein